MKQKTAICFGGSGFIGHSMGRRLMAEGYWVRCVDIKPYEFGEPDFCNEFILGDLRNKNIVESTLRLNKEREYSFFPKPFEEVEEFDEVYQFACQMGGAGYVFTGENDSDIMHDSALINVNTLNELSNQNFKGKVFYSSSACIYPQEIQTEYQNEGLKESDAYPGNPDSDYGWEKLFSERLYMAYARNKNIDVRIARFHNIFGVEGTYEGGREKAPAALCRKVIEATDEIEVWGNGLQTRSFLYIDECIEGVRRLMESNHKDPINIGSDYMISINDLAKMIIKHSGKNIKIKNIDGPIGVMGRNSDNTKLKEILGWTPTQSLVEGIIKTYKFIEDEINK